MDELTAQLAADFSVSSDPNSIAAQHPRYSQYKSRGDVPDQNTRRSKILKAQKRQRFDYLCHTRCLSEDTWEKADAESVASNDSMEVQLEGEEVKLRKPGRNFKNQLMMSEWLVEVPEDFAESWCTVICPWGKRCLVVASRGRTTAYSRGGYRLNTFSSNLPGGCKSQPGRFKDNAILDCLFNEAEGTYYVLDIMCWKNHPVYDSETEFRFFWLHSKFSEEPDLGIKSDENPFKFVALPNFVCTQESIGLAINTANFEIDGILFYHKRTHYTFGSTPLVVWLKPYMVPEILNIQVIDKIMEKRPDSYTNYAAHMTAVATEKEKAKELRKQKESEKKQGVKILQREHGKGDGSGQDTKSDGQISGGGSGGGGGGKRGKGRRKKGGAAAHMDVMFSEWMTEVPEDLVKNWFMIICPKGKRNLVISAQGRTFTQSKQGLLLEDFPSCLPGGNVGDQKGMSVLDCIYNKKDDVYYVLDMMFWKSQDMTDCDSEFRIFWMNERLAEQKSIGRRTKINPHKFVPLKSYACTKKVMNQAMSSTDLEVDGVLFYHKSLPYRPGVSSQILWLKPYMMSEALGVDVSPQLAAAPASYTTFADHVESVKEEEGENKSGKAGGRQKAKPCIDIDKIVEDIGDLYISKRQLEADTIGPVHIRDRPQTSVWRAEQSGRRHGDGLLGDPRQIYGADYYDQGAYHQGYYNQWYSNQGYCDQSYRGYQDWNSQNYGGYSSNLPAVGARGAWGYEEHKKARQPKGRGGLLKLSAMDSYKQTHKIFKE
ncbi:uncharacterized protein LOC117335093 [Pecten maximus]|uniref:uncharacterized protein LOC117335093 n=1 Tax=Pecten maximus TaxID=6579 RepID=UPI0014580385|nr:uncharacterized protein LOC117335093 [Pecten maximus]XP_033750906.1 uncharacterized protein LOC117335093 [Pecten maximus]